MSIKLLTGMINGFPFWILKIIAWLVKISAEKSPCYRPKTTYLEPINELCVAS